MRRRPDPQPETGAEDIRAAELERLRERAARLARILVRLPASRRDIPTSEARRDLLCEFGMTAACQADRGVLCAGNLDLVGQTVDGYAMWLGPEWTPDGQHYTASRDEVLAIVAAALEEAKTP